MFLILDQLAVADDLAQLGDRRTPPRDLLEHLVAGIARENANFVAQLADQV